MFIGPRLNESIMTTFAVALDGEIFWYCACVGDTGWAVAVAIKIGVSISICASIQGC